MSLQIIQIVLVLESRGDFINFNLTSILMSIPGVIIAVTLHEFVKSLVAHRLGDTGIKSQGRLSLNPLKHMDILGSIFLIIFGYGWAAPVRLAPFPFANRKKAAVLIFVMPFLANIIMGAVFAIAGSILRFNFHGLAGAIGLQNFVIIEGILYLAAFYNLAFALFNIIPVYPLDGIRLLGGFKPVWAMKISQHEKIFQIVIAFFIILGFAGMLFNPIVNALIGAMSF